MLELQHISWTAPGGSQVVRDVSFSVPEGKLTVITGPNGGGKTTLEMCIRDSIKRPTHVRGGCTPGKSRLGQLAPLVLIKRLTRVRAVGG